MLKVYNIAESKLFHYYTPFTAIIKYHVVLLEQVPPKATAAPPGHTHCRPGSPLHP